jgi:hypothetical protein
MSTVPTNSHPALIKIAAGALGTRQFPVDTSFEPYRREAFRHRSIPTQRDSISLDNVPGEGMVNTEGLWRREQVELSMGAGQQYLDRRRDSDATRFRASKGVDVFSFPMQATLLPDTHRLDSGAVDSSLKMSRCGDYVIVTTNAGATRYDSSWNAVTFTFDTTTYGGSSPSAIRGIATNDTYAYIATDTGLWFGNPANLVSGHPVFQLYAAPDTSTGYGGGYDMVAWANDQLLASSHQNLSVPYYGNRIYAFQPRSATSAPIFGTAPTTNNVSLVITNITNSAGTATVYCAAGGCSQLQAKQQVTLAGVRGQSNAASGGGGNLTLSGSTATATPSTGEPSGFSVGDTVTVTNYFTGVQVGRTETVVILSVSSTSPYAYTYTTTKFGPRALATGWLNTVATDVTSGYNATFTVQSVISDTEFTISAPLITGCAAQGGSTASVTADLPPDVLFTHDNPNYVWSSATGGETQIYIGGYVKSANGNGYSGCVYRSSLLGSSTTTETGVTTITNSIVAQPWALDTPVQALPMSPDEYPTCVSSYLNYIFVGTNRGIRMCQTLSIYDPTATATGDLKSGPLSPNILQPVTQPVTAIVGDGRYVWFAWNNYDGSSTGLGKLDLQTNINGDALAPAYASDLMVTGQGLINSLDWDPNLNIPIMAVASLGVYGPYATNEGGNLIVSQYVPSGSFYSGVFDYGLSDPKIAVFFNYDVVTPSTSYATATVYLDPLDPNGAGAQVLDSYTYGDDKQVSMPLPYVQADQFEVEFTMYSDSTHVYSPTWHRWTLQSWPAIVSGTNIMLVIQNFDVNVVEGGEEFTDSYETVAWFDELRTTQTIITYTEGPLSAIGVVALTDWLPHKLRDNYNGGYEGDFIVTITTLAPYTLNEAPTS